jgi:hypothetical protein
MISDSSAVTRYGPGAMFSVIASFSSLQEALWQAAVIVGPGWLIVAVIECAVLAKLYHLGFRFRQLPDFFCAALAKLRGLFRHN